MKKSEYFHKLKEIVDSLIHAQDLTKQFGIDNISQPGIIKEIITAHVLKHRLHPSKKDHDAEDFDDSTIKYEYLSCLQGKSFQFDRVDDVNMIKRIKERNAAVFCSVFSKQNPLVLLRPYQVDPETLFNILRTKYKCSTSTSRHVGITENELKPLIESKKAELYFETKNPL